MAALQKGWGKAGTGAFDFRARRLVAVDLRTERFTVLGTVGDDDALERLAITADETVAVSHSMAGAIHCWRLDAAAPTPDRGLHLDGNIAQGDPVRVVRRQIRAYGRR